MQARRRGGPADCPDERDAGASAVPLAPAGRVPAGGAEAAPPLGRLIDWLANCGLHHGSPPLLRSSLRKL